MNLPDRLRHVTNTFRSSPCALQIPVVRARRHHDYVQSFPQLREYLKDDLAGGVLTTTDRRHALLSTLALVALSTTWTPVAHSEGIMLTWLTSAQSTGLLTRPVVLCCAEVLAATSTSSSLLSPDPSTHLKDYINRAQGYRLSIPVSWEKIDKVILSCLHKTTSAILFPHFHVLQAGPSH
jgi:hypothetical protein